MWKKILALLFVLVSGIVEAAAVDADAFAAGRGLDRARTALLVYDIEGDSVVVQLNPSLPLVPASIMKCVTAATALEKSGHAYRYDTKVYVSGVLADGVLNGNIEVIASGDPSLNSRHCPESPDLVSQITDALQERGITEIKGTVIINEAAFPGPAVNPTWASGDLPHAYGTGTHGFNFEDNARGKSSVADPASVFVSRLKCSLSNAGMSLGGDTLVAVGPRQLLCRHLSPPVDEVMRSCMMRSDNQFAEALLRLVGNLYANEGSIKQGSRQMKEYWKKRKANMDGVEIVDGSGLSRSNRVTARFMADVLLAMCKDPYYASFFPLAGQEGTLKKFLANTPLEGEIALKTGSMSGIQCYAGYKLDDDYSPTHVVVAIMNGISDRAAARTALQKLLLEIFDPSV